MQHSFPIGSFLVGTVDASGEFQIHNLFVTQTDALAKYQWAMASEALRNFGWQVWQCDRTGQPTIKIAGD